MLLSPEFKEILIKADIDPKDFFNAVMKAMQSGWKPLEAAASSEVNMFKQIMIPQIASVGLCDSDYIQEKYKKARLRMVDDMTFLNMLEDNLVNEQ